MNIIIGRIYQAPWGRYVGHREGVLRSLDSFTAFSIQPHPDDYIDTGEDLPSCEPRPQRATSAPDASPATAIRPSGSEETHKASPHDTTTRQDTQPGPKSTWGSTTEASRSSVLTLGGLRPGSVYCIVPGRPQLEWKPCLTRDDAKAGPHLWYLASTDEASLYCPRCRPHDAASFVEIAAAVAAGKGAAVFTDHPFAKMLLRVSLKTTRAKRWAQTGPEVDGGPVPGALQAPVEAVIGSERPAVGVTAGETAIEREEVPSVTAGETAPTGVQYTAHCCPRIVLGHGLHSPQCANYAGEAPPAAAPLVRDDPKAEAGSFEREAFWRPRYRNRADYDEWFTERAAICEYLGGMRRELAERAARRLAGPPP